MRINTADSVDRIVLLLAWFCVPKKYANVRVEQFLNSGKAVVGKNDYGEGKVPHFFTHNQYKVQRIFDVYPRLNYRYIMKKLEGTEWGWYIPHNLIESYAYAEHEDAVFMSAPMRKTLVKTINKVLKGNFEKVLSYLLEEDSFYGRENLLIFFWNKFMTIEQTKYFLTLDEARDGKYREFTLHCIGGLKKWDENYEYTGYPDEWVTEAYGLPFAVNTERYPYSSEKKPEKW